MKKYPDEFTLSDMTDHIDDLLFRFENKALGDTVFRVGCDLKRKLHRDDRILGPLIDGIETQSRVDKILLTFVYGLSFKAKDEAGNYFPGDMELLKTLEKEGLDYVLINLCGLNRNTDSGVILMIRAAHLQI
jgi:mannitol-1-phosphate 5-dehydrogenase